MFSQYWNDIVLADSNPNIPEQIIKTSRQNVCKKTYLGAINGTLKQLYLNQIFSHASFGDIYLEHVLGLIRESFIPKFFMELYRRTPDKSIIICKEKLVDEDHCHIY